MGFGPRTSRSHDTVTKTIAILTMIGRPRFSTADGSEAGTVAGETVADGRYYRSSDVPPGH